MQLSSLLLDRSALMASTLGAQAAMGWYARLVGSLNADSTSREVIASEWHAGAQGALQELEEELCNTADETRGVIAALEAAALAAAAAALAAPDNGLLTLAPAPTGLPGGSGGGGGGSSSCAGGDSPIVVDISAAVLRWHEARVARDGNDGDGFAAAGDISMFEDHDAAPINCLGAALAREGDLEGAAASGCTGGAGGTNGWQPLAVCDRTLQMPVGPVECTADAAGAALAAIRGAKSVLHVLNAAPWLQRTASAASLLLRANKAAAASALNSDGALDSVDGAASDDAAPLAGLALAIPTRATHSTTSSAAASSSSGILPPEAAALAAADGDISPQASYVQILLAPFEGFRTAAMIASAAAACHHDAIRSRGGGHGCVTDAEDWAAARCDDDGGAIADHSDSADSAIQMRRVHEMAPSRAAATAGASATDNRSAPSSWVPGSREDAAPARKLPQARRDDSGAGSGAGSNMLTDDFQESE